MLHVVPTGRRTSPPSPRKTLIRESALEHTVTLLSKYPNISDQDTAEVIRFIRSARYVEMGLLSSETAVRRQLDRFMRDHRAKLRTSPVRLAFAILMVIIAFLIWSSGIALMPGATS